MRWVLGVAVMALLIGAMAATGVIAQSDSGYEVRVRAMRLVDGRTEFEVQQRNVGGGWSNSLFASNPRLSSDPTVGRWYSSRGVSLNLLEDSSMQLVEDGAAEVPAEEVEAEAPWSPIGSTGGEIDVRLSYSVETDLLTGGYTTIVETRANPVGQDFSYYDLVLSMVCTDGELHLLAWDTLGFGVEESESILVRIGDEPAETEFWEGQYSSSFHGYSPENDRAFIERLRSVDSVIVRVGGPENDAYEVHLAGFFDTPAQGNIDRCGTY